MVSAFICFFEKEKGIVMQMWTNKNIPWIIPMNLTITKPSPEQNKAQQIHVNIIHTYIYNIHNLLKLSPWWCHPCVQEWNKFILVQVPCMLNAKLVTAKWDVFPYFFLRKSSFNYISFTCKTKLWLHCQILKQVFCKSMLLTMAGKIRRSLSILSVNHESQWCLYWNWSHAVIN